MPLIGSISMRRPKSTKWLGGRVSSNCSGRRAVLAGGRERPAFDQVLDRPVGIAGKKAIVIEHRIQSDRVFTDRAGRDQDVDLGLSRRCLRARDRSLAGQSSPAAGGNAPISRLSLLPIPIVGASPVASRRGWTSRRISSFDSGPLDLEVKDLAFRAQQRLFPQLGETGDGSIVDRDDLVARRKPAS